MFYPCCYCTCLCCLQGEGGWQRQEGEAGPGVVLGGGGAVAGLGTHRQAAPGLPSPVPHHHRGGPHHLQPHGIDATLYRDILVIYSEESPRVQLFTGEMDVLCFLELTQDLL